MNKRILIVYSKNTVEVFNRQSALGSYIYCLCEILEKVEFHVFVNGISFDELKKNPPVRNEIRDIQGRGILKYIPKFLKDIIKDILVFKNMKRLSQFIQLQESYDCVLEFNHYGSDVGLTISNKQKIPLVFIYDGPVLEDFVFFQGPKYFFKNKILKFEKETVLHASQIVVYSNAVKQYLNNLAGKELTISIHQNVDFSRFDFLENQFLDKHIKIGFIGSFLKWHRIDLLIEAFNRLRDANYSVELFLVGNGMEHDSIKQIVSKSEYENFIHMPGFLDGKELLEIKKQLHIGVMPGSNWYGAPNKIFEYGAAKIAVVAPNTLTISDLFEDKKELLLFKQDDGKELYNKLRMLCDDLTLCQQLATALQQKIKNKYSEKNTTEFYSKILRDAMSDK